MILTDPEQIYLKTAEEWQRWLDSNHNKSKGIWLIYYKKHTGRPRIPYSEAVEVALCFGWIDSLVKRIDEDTYMQKFTPRKPGSNWSELNKKRVQKLIREGKMQKSGLKMVEIAKENGKWDKAYMSQKNFELSEEMLDRLKTNPRAYKRYEKLPASHKKNYNNWVMSAKKKETQIKRCSEMLRLLEKGRNLGMK